MGGGLLAGLINILPHCPGLLRGGSLCGAAADTAHSVSAAYLRIRSRRPALGELVLRLCATEQTASVERDDGS